MILQAALICLSANIFHEARGESIPGQYAVAQVTMRRAHNDQRKVCAVVHAPKQFSWTLKLQGDPRKIDPDAWIRARKIAMMVLQQKVPRDFFNKGANHFHANYVAPKWAYRLPRTVVIGKHIFYKA